MIEDILYYMKYMFPFGVLGSGIDLLIGTEWIATIGILIGAAIASEKKKDNIHAS